MNYLLVMPKSAAKSSGGYNVFPVGVAYVSAAMKKHGLSVTTTNLEFDPRSTADALRDLIRSHDIGAVCVGGLSRDYAKIREVLRAAREARPDIITIAGGGIVSSDPAAGMAALEADIGVVGQGELTMCELADALDQGASYDQVPGLVYRGSNGDWILTTPRPDVDDLDSIPWPDYEGFAFSQYVESTQRQGIYVIGSRSCPFSCTFCYHPSGKKYRQRSLQDLLDEIDYLVTAHDVRNVIVSDELFAYERGRVVEFCDRIKRYSIEWSIQLRVCDVDRELLDLMRAAGCCCVSFGIESADDRVLTSMKKHITVAQIDRALAMTREAGLEIQGGLIFGDVAETIETVANSMRWHAAHPEYGLELNMIHIFPGTPLYKEALRRGVIASGVEYVREGCPLVNVSQLTDEEYRELSSRLYDMNMCPTYAPRDVSVRQWGGNGCVIDASCDQCGTAFTSFGDALHTRRERCPRCRQRYFIDPFARLDHRSDAFAAILAPGERVALWGAGEICIKLLETYEVLRGERTTVVDISKSRQGYTVLGKKIENPSAILAQQIRAVIVAVAARKDEVLRALRDISSVTDVWLPDAECTGHGAALVLRRLPAGATDGVRDRSRVAVPAA
jgi:anaerobic magnesium-protoporphyrin IX monomethyl ester cyclase